MSRHLGSAADYSHKKVCSPEFDSRLVGRGRLVKIAQTIPFSVPGLSLA
jgi:hypothetical protein